MFVDGVAQPYSAVYEDGTVLEENYMQAFNLDYEQKENFNMVFQPVTGTSGETVPVMAVTILEPSFVAEGPDNPRYGFHHQESQPHHARFLLQQMPQSRHWQFPI